jgi:signal transduction histidine kinase
LLFLAAMVTAWGAGQLPAGSSGRPGPENRWWQVLALLLTLACLWEFFGLESWLGAQAQAMAYAGDLYHARIVLQKVVISIAVAATGVFLLFVRRAHSSRRLLLVGFGLYLGISLVNLMSLHAIDRIADLSWHGLALLQALKIGCAAMTLRGVAIASRKHCGEGL